MNTHRRIQRKRKQLNYLRANISSQLNQLSYLHPRQLNKVPTAAYIFAAIGFSYLHQRVSRNPRLRYVQKLTRRSLLIALNQLKIAKTASTTRSSHQ